MSTVGSQKIEPPEAQWLSKPADAHRHRYSHRGECIKKEIEIVKADDCLLLRRFPETMFVGKKVEVL